MIEKWGLIIAWDIPNDCYIASVPELLACTGAGQTRQEALEALEQEVERWLRTSRELSRVGSISETQKFAAMPTEKPQPVKSVALGPQEEALGGNRAATTRFGCRLELLKPSTNRGLTITIARNLPIILLAGEGNISNCSSLEQAYRDVLDAGTNGLVLDLTEMKYMDSAMLAVMVGAVREFKKVDGIIYLVSSKEPFVNRLFQITRLDRIFWMCNTLDEAIETLGTSPVFPD